VWPVRRASLENVVKTTVLKVASRVVMWWPEIALNVKLDITDTHAWTNVVNARLEHAR
jgi:hypothetical protein